MSIKDRFEAKFIPEPNSGCWLWLGAINPNGYGRMLGENGKLRTAHAISYELHKGQIPTGLQIDHLCRNRQCVNPDHLEAVTQEENILRGDSPTAIHARKTHCKNGHEFTPSNTWVFKGGRRCIKCRHTQDAKYRAK